MVRVGGGWMALDEFLVKNDPCRGEYSHKNQNKQYQKSHIKYNMQANFMHELEKKNNLKTKLKIFQSQLIRQSHCYNRKFKFDH